MTEPPSAVKPNAKAAMAVQSTGRPAYKGPTPYGIHQAYNTGISKLQAMNLSSAQRGSAFPSTHDDSQMPSQLSYMNQRMNMNTIKQMQQGYMANFKGSPQT